MGGGGGTSTGKAEPVVKKSVRPRDGLQEHMILERNKERCPTVQPHGAAVGSAPTQPFFCTFPRLLLPLPLLLAAGGRENGRVSL